MLLIANRLSELNFSELMRVYREGNIENAEANYPTLPPPQRELAVERDFYHYLNEAFFSQKNSFYAIWLDAGKYRAALRIEPYRDGVLMCALETAPEHRRRGYASALISQVATYLSAHDEQRIYSHISKRNTASLAVHKKCGFSIHADFAVYSDGSVLQNSYTMVLPLKKSESQ